MQSLAPKQKLLAALGLFLVASVGLIVWSFARDGDSTDVLPLALGPVVEIAERGELESPEAVGATSAPSSAANGRAEVRRVKPRQQRKAAKQRVTRPAFDVWVDELPGTRIGSYTVRADFFERGKSAVVGSETQVVLPNGRVHFERGIARASDPRLDVLFSLLSYADLSDEPTPLVEGTTGLGKLELQRGVVRRLRPGIPLVGLCVLSKKPAIMRKESLSIRFLERYSARNAVGVVVFPREYLEHVDYYELRLRQRKFTLATDQYPVGSDGLIRVPFHELHTSNRELVVTGAEALPGFVNLEVEREVRGTYKLFKGPGTKKNEVQIRRTVGGWTCKPLTPGRYRAWLTMNNAGRGGRVLLGDADLRFAEHAVFEAPSDILRRNLIVRLKLPPDLKPDGLRPYRVRLDPERADARWLRIDRGTLRYSWLGPLPRTAEFSGRHGPVVPRTIPLEWIDERIAVLDLTGERLHRCRILPSAEGEKFHLPETRAAGFGKRLRSTPPAYHLLERGGHKELLWWEGADFRIPVSRSSGSWNTDRPVMVLEVLEPNLLRGAATHRLPPAPLPNERLELRSSHSLNLLVYLWLGAGVPDESVMGSTSAERARDPRVISLGSTGRSSRETVYPPGVGAGLLISSQRTGKTAYLPRERWSKVVEIASLDWR